MPSPATQIRDAIATRLTGRSWLPVTTLRKQVRPQLQEEDLPALVVVVADEQETPEDEANTGQPRFTNEVTIGISYCVSLKLPEDLDDLLDAATDQIRATLLTDPTFVRGVDPSKALNDPARYPLFEAVTKVRRGRLFPQAGATYFAEGRLELTFQFRTSYDPVIPDMLEHVTFAARPNGAGAQTPAINGRVDYPTT